MFTNRGRVKHQNGVDVLVHTSGLKRGWAAVQCCMLVGFGCVGTLCLYGE